MSIKAEWSLGLSTIPHFIQQAPLPSPLIENKKKMVRTRFVNQYMSTMSTDIGGLDCCFMPGDILLRESRASGRCLFEMGCQSILVS